MSLGEPHESVDDFDQDDGNNIENKNEYWEIVVRYNGQSPENSCRQSMREGGGKGWEE